MSDIPKYKGREEKETPFTFLIRLEDHMRVHEYTKEEMLEKVINFALTEDAYQWFRFRHSEIQTGQNLGRSLDRNSNQWAIRGSFSVNCGPGLKGGMNL